MELAGRPVFCELKTDKPAAPLQVQKPKLVELPQTANDNGKIVLQPRLCTLRSYSGDRLVVIKAKNSVNGGDQVSSFFATLSEYIESSKKSQDFETISGRLAMIVFAATVSIETVTGNSVFRKMDLQGMAEAAGVCLAAVTSAAIIAWFSSARKGSTLTQSKGWNPPDLLHQTLFPGLYGIGDLGSQSFKFLDWLHEAGCSLWQVLPLVPPGRRANEEGSPYSGLVILFLADANCAEHLTLEYFSVPSLCHPCRDMDLVNFSTVSDIKDPLITEVFKFRPTNPEEWRSSPLVHNSGKSGCDHTLYILGPDIQDAVLLHVDLPLRRADRIPRRDEKAHHNFTSTEQLSSNINVAFQLPRGFKLPIFRREPSYFTTAPYLWGLTFVRVCDTCMSKSLYR